MDETQDSTQPAANGSGELEDESWDEDSRAERASVQCNDAGQKPDRTLPLSAESKERRRAVF
jgi:hypothetical protein